MELGVCDSQNLLTMDLCDPIFANTILRYTSLSKKLDSLEIDLFLLPVLPPGAGALPGALADPEQLLASLGL